MLSKCTQELYTLWPDVILKTAGEANGLAALFLGKKGIMLSKCKRLTLNDTFDPFWIRSPDASYWIAGHSAVSRGRIPSKL
jgi:hypothetical protein